MTKTQIIAEHVVVTFFEAGIAYLAINQTSLSGSPKVVVIGALGAALSAAYNLLRQSTPTLPPAPIVTPAVVAPTPPLDTPPANPVS